MGEGINFAEYTVARKCEGKNLAARAALVFSYIAFGILYVFFFIYLRIPQLIAVLPIFLWMAVFFSWRYVSYDYRCEIEKGQMRVLKVLGKKCKELVSFHIKDALEIAPLKDKAGGDVIYDLRGTKNSTDSYFAVFIKDKKRVCVCFEATSALVKLMHRLNENTVISKELRF